MINIYEGNENNNMIEHEKLDVRTITLGISLLDCAGGTLSEVNEKIYKKITSLARDLVSTGKAIEQDFGIPIVNKRVSVTPIALVGALIAGGVTGAVTGILHTKMGIPGILAGILTQLALYSINLRIMGNRSNVSVSVDQFPLMASIRYPEQTCLIALLFCVGIVAVLCCFF